MSKENKSFIKKALRIASLVLIILLVTISALFLYGWTNRPIPLPSSIINLGAPWEDKRPVYDGAGKLILHMSEEELMPNGSSVVKKDPLYSKILAEERPVIVYLPEGYEETGEPYPIIFALHGFASRPQSLVNILIDPLEEAISNGSIPPVIVAFLDFSISGNSTDYPDTPYDDRGGSWYINSNLGRFEDHFFKEIIPFIFTEYNTRTDPDGVILLGSSMGGYGVLYYGIKFPRFSRILVPVYGSFDLRYGIGGNKLLNYDPNRYAPIDLDDPKRIVNGSVFGGLFGVTEEWLYYPVFDSDRMKGEVWKEDRPVWERLMVVNPAEMLRGGKTDLTGQRYYIIVGGKDDFNLDAHVPVILPLLKSSGAKVYPEENVINKERHKPHFIKEHIDEILIWIGNELMS